MSPPRILGLTPRGAQIMALLIASEGGMSRQEISDRIGVKPTTVAEHLYRIRKLGLIKATQPVYLKWRSDINSDDLEALVVAAADRATARQASPRRKKKTVELDAEAMPIQRTVSASTCEPVRPRAPASVFHQVTA